MKKLSLTFTILTLTLSQASLAYDCDHGDTLSISSKVEETSDDVSTVTDNLFDSNATKDLFNAIAKDDLAGVKAALKLNANPNAFKADGKASDRFSALSYAVKFSTPAIVKEILENGGDPNLRNKDLQETTPLMIASRFHRVDSLVHLVDPKYKADINAKASGDRTALHFAVTNHCTGCISTLVALDKINLNSWSAFVLGAGGAPIAAASFYGHPEDIKALLAHSDQTTPITQENLDAAIATLNKGAEVVDGKSRLKPEDVKTSINDIEAYRKKRYP